MDRKKGTGFIYEKENEFWQSLPFSAYIDKKSHAFEIV
jgi:hypothetical protein